MQSTAHSPTGIRNPLLIPELFQSILDGLQVSPLYGNRIEDVKQMRRALAALAQTCRALSEPSLDRLWQKLDSLGPLIRCFAPDADVDSASRAMVPPSPAEWKIITRYSHRIRELALRSYIDDIFLSSVASCLQSPFLFPNLRVLVWSPPIKYPDLGAIMHRLLSPSLVSLAAFVEHTGTVKPFLQTYIQLCPRLNLLKSIEFDICQAVEFDWNISISEIHQLSQAICIHEHLESLNVSVPIDDVALRQLMLSPRLRVISLVLHPLESNLGNIRITSPDIPFRNVKKLELHVWDFHFVSSLLRTKDQIFHTFRLRVGGVHDPKAISAFLTALASPQRTDSLQSIDLTCFNWYPDFHEVDNISYDDNSVHSLTYSTLRPLTPLNHLRELVLLLSNQISLNDGELVELARSWPLLEVLKLRCSDGCYSTSITLEGLLSLLTLLPRLRGLSLSLDAREVPEDTSVGVCNTILTCVKLPDSPICDARLVADFFSLYLPSVTSIDVSFVGTQSISYQPPERYGLLWGKVNEYLQVG